MLRAFDRVPGPTARIGRRLRVNWLNGLWALMAMGTIVQLGGILTALTGVFGLAALDLGWVPAGVWPIGIALLTAALLAAGRYRLVERTTTILVCVFTGVTVLAVFCVQRTDSAIRGAELINGLVPSVPEAGILTAFAVLGITGVGASELVYYPYWCLEKGYARYAGTPGSTPEEYATWLRRAKGWLGVMQLDAWLSFALYTVGTTAFYLLGAAVLHRRGIVPDDEQLHDALSRIYTVSFGEAAGSWLYAAGAAAVLFSTFFVATASNSRVVADALHVFGITRLDDDRKRLRVVRILCLVMPLFCWAMVAFVGKPVRLIMVGAVAQAAILPFLGLAIAYLRYRHTARELVTRSVTDLFLFVAILSTGAICFYQLYRVFVPQP